MKKILTGYVVTKVELKTGIPLEQTLKYYEEMKSPNTLVAEKLGVHIQTVNFWRKKMKFPKRKFI